MKKSSLALMTSAIISLPICCMETDEKRFELSEELYKKSLSCYETEQLYGKGAIINYRSKSYNVSPLSYWTQSDDPNSPLVMATLIALGADPNYDALWKNNSFSVSIEKNNHNKLNILLDYYTKMQGKSIISKEVWGKILILYYHDLMHFKKCPELIEHLIANVPQESCTTGLMACLEVREPLYDKQRTQLRQKFINCKADKGAALAHCCEHIEMYPSSLATSYFMQDSTALIEAGAYSTEAITTLANLSAIFNYMATKVQNNCQK